MRTTNSQHVASRVLTYYTLLPLDAFALARLCRSLESENATPLFLRVLRDRAGARRSRAPAAHVTLYYTLKFELLLQDLHTKKEKILPKTNDTICLSKRLF